MRFRRRAANNGVHGPRYGTITRQPFLRYFVPLSVVSAALLVGILAMGASTRSEDSMAEFASQQRHHVDSLGLDASERLSSAIGDMAIIVKQAPLIELSDEPSRAELDAVANLFISISTYRSTYQQIRLIDTTGMELVRVDLDRDLQPIRVSDLQNKASRYYFTSSIGLPDGAVFVSPVDLNIEFGEIEQPLRPMLRFGSPIYGSDGRLKAVVVVNQNAQSYVGLIAGAGSLEGTVYVANEEGYWLHAPDESLEWGFMYDRDDLRLSAGDPEAWQQISDSPIGQFETDNGLYTFRQFNPLIGVNDSGIPTFQEDGTLRWTIYSLASPGQIQVIRDSANTGMLELGLLLAAIVVALSAVTSFALGRRWAAGLIEREAAFVLDAAGDAIVITDRDANLIRVNDAFTKLTGYSADSVVGASVTTMTVDLDLGEVMAKIRQSGRWSGRTRTIRADGSEATQRIAISRIVDGRGDTSRFIAVFNDVSTDVAKEQQLEKLATHDRLTGLGTRALITAAIERALAASRRSGNDVAVMFLDLDGFKQVNDTLGHHAGDEVLIEVAARLTAVVREVDTAGRFGGDEFVVVLPNIASATDADRVASRILEALDYPINTSEGPATVGASIGMSLTDGNFDCTPAGLIEAADTAMYDAKRSGGQRAVRVEIDCDATSGQDDGDEGSSIGPINGPGLIARRS